MLQSERSSAAPLSLSLSEDGEYWTTVYDGRLSRIRNSKGLAYIAHLVRFPKEEFHVVELLAQGSQAQTCATADNPAVERARKAVCNRIRAAVAKIQVRDPSLGEHLAAAIRTGRFCSYQPRIRPPISAGPGNSSA